MIGETHFIEICKDIKTSKQITYPLQEIKNLQRNLSLTKNCRDIKTIAVWKIKAKK